LMLLKMALAHSKGISLVTLDLDEAFIWNIQAL
jgi:hypothetical protein